MPDSGDPRREAIVHFPNDGYADAAAFADAYFDTLKQAAETVDRSRILAAAQLLEETHRRRGSVFACGNGGSAAIANHLACDHCKSVAVDTSLRPSVISLSANVEIITAIANDISFGDIFAYQLRALARPSDVLVTVSSSGDSDNVVHAAEWARANGVTVIAMTGFTGGRLAKAADVNLHVAAENYGIIEDTHQALMHILAQWLRMAHMDPALIPQRRF
jgi:D-sedoheptulose 7-phosphate isomerase